MLASSCFRNCVALEVTQPILRRQYLDALIYFDLRTIKGTKLRLEDVIIRPLPQDIHPTKDISRSKL